MQNIDVSQLISEFEFENDKREPPDKARRKSFKQGLKHANSGGTYTSKTLKKSLTWQNLGYRLGKIGTYSEQDPDQLFDSLAAEFSSKELNQPAPEPIYQSKTKSKTEELGMVTPQNFQFPEEVDKSEVQILREGAVQQVTVNAYERNPKARQLCIAHYGLSCYVCGFNFEERYGEVGKDFIHVHHERPLSTIGEEYEVDPIQDLKPVCANCHAIIHRQKSAYSVEAVREMLH